MAKIGNQLRALRTRRQLSTRELALRSGVSHTTVSLIERDRISPSIDTLQAILDALGSRLAEFLDGLHDGRRSPFYPAADLPEIGNPDSISYRLIGLHHPYRSFQFLKESYAVGADTGEMLTHAAQEAGCVVAGAVEVTVGEQIRVLREGDGYYFDSSEPHRFRNVGSSVAQIVSAVSPPSY